MRRYMDLGIFLCGMSATFVTDIYRKFAVDVVEFVFVFAIVFLQVFFINLFEVVQIVGAFGVYTFVEDKVLAVFFGNKCMAAVGVPQLHGRKAALLWREQGTVYLAEYLPFGAVVFVEIRHGRITAWAGAVLRDVAVRAAVYRLDLLPIAFFDIGDELFVSPVLAKVGDKGQLVCFEFLVFRGMGVIKSPLPEWDVSADEHDEPAVLLVKVLNELK